MIYLNNAGTSWPRPAGVAEGSRAAGCAEPERWPAILVESRAEVASFLGIPDPERLLLTPGCTSALSLAIADLPWSVGDRVLTSALEHHALIRPVTKLARERGVEHLVAPWAPGRPVDLDWVAARLREGRVRLVACSAASNVTGDLLPVEALVALAHEHGALCLVDAAQTAGTFPLDATALGADLVAFAGHKGPLGPQGIGGLYVAPGVALESPAASCELRAEGEGACSPFPSYCDAGSVNLAGLAGLAAGLRWRRARGPEALRERVVALTRRLLDGLREIPGLTLHGPSGDAPRGTAVSITLAGHDPAELERRLAAEHGIAARAGHHCAPLAHETIGTAATGTLRLSFGPLNDEDDAGRALAALHALAGGRR